MIPVGTGALVLTVLATWWGWWRPALFEGRRFGPTWALISPALLVLAYLLNLSTTNFARLTLGFLLLATLGTLLVGFSAFLTVGTGSSGILFTVVIEGVAYIIALIALRRITAAKMAGRRDALLARTPAD